MLFKSVLSSPKEKSRCAIDDRRFLENGRPVKKVRFAYGALVFEGDEKGLKLSFAKWQREKIPQI